MVPSSLVLRREEGIFSIHLLHHMMTEESPRGHSPERFSFQTSDIKWAVAHALQRHTRSQNGPQPIHDVVVSAVMAAVAAATITFNSTSQKREFFIPS